MAMIFALTELQKASVENYECGYFKQGMQSMIEDALKQLMVLVRPQMIPLVEAFDFSDGHLTSAIGNSYGDIYET